MLRTFDKSPSVSLINKLLYLFGTSILNMVGVCYILRIAPDNKYNYVVVQKVVWL